MEYDINSLITFTEKKDKSYSKNRVLRVLDTFAENIRANFPRISITIMKQAGIL